MYCPFLTRTPRFYPAKASESGLYKLLFYPRKPEAEAFQNWVTQEVLPSIRKTGRFSRALPKYVLCHTLYDCSFMPFGQMHVAFCRLKVPMTKQFTDVEQASAV